MTAAIHLLYLPFSARRLAAFARRHRADGGDTGYMVHAALTAAFGHRAPKPFAVAGEAAGLLSVYAYARGDMAIVRDWLDPLAPPEVDALVDWASAAVKSMPCLPVGSRLRFAVRACPTVRLGRALAGEKAPGAETDAHLAALDRWAAAGSRAEDKPERGDVYLDWFRAFLDRHRGAAVESLRLAGFRIEGTLRKTAPDEDSGRVAVCQRRPVADFEGVLRVTDADAFTELLARGVGRHRAFGFGMLMLRRAG